MFLPADSCKTVPRDHGCSWSLIEYHEQDYELLVRTFANIKNGRSCSSFVEAALHSGKGTNRLIQTLPNINESLNKALRAQSGENSARAE
jgi:hypothetical protein